MYKSNLKTDQGQTAPHQRQRQQRHHCQQLLANAEQMASFAAYVADGLANIARTIPSARTARLATDALALACHAHALAVAILAETESEVAA